MAALRGRQWWYFVGVPLISWRVGVGLGAVVVATGVAACCLAVAYAINAVVERASDRDTRKNPLVAAPHHAAAVMELAAWLAVIAMIGAAVLGGVAVVAVVVSLAAGLIYNAGAKRVPGLGLVCNLLIFAPLCWLLHDGGAVALASVAEAVLFVLLLAQSQVLHELADAAEDAAAGAETTVQWLGPSASRGLLWVLAAAVWIACTTLLVHPVAQTVAASLAVVAPMLAHATAPTTARTWQRRLVLGGGVVIFAVLTG